MSQLNTNVIAPVTPGGVIDFQGSGPTSTPTYNGAVIGFGRMDVVTIAGTTYTIQPSDMGKCLRTTSSSPVSITAPPSLPSLALYCIRQAGSGLVTVVPGSGVTIPSPSGLVAAGPGASLFLHVVGTSLYDISGDLA